MPAPGEETEEGQDADSSIKEQPGNTKVKTAAAFINHVMKGMLSCSSDYMLHVCEHIILPTQRS
jgi:hypothetical protein